MNSALHVLNVSLHVLTGTLALLLGLIAFATTKGSARHRWVGRRFLYLTLPVIVTAAIGVLRWRWSMPLAAATLAASYTLLSAWRTVHTRAQGPTRLDSALAVLAAIAALLALVAMTTGTVSWTPAIGYATAGSVLAWSLYDLSRLRWCPCWTPRAWQLDHGVKLTSTFFAMAAAFSGNVLTRWQPWSQFLPSLIGVLVMVYWLWRYGRRPMPISARP